MKIENNDLLKHLAPETRKVETDRVADEGRSPNRVAQGDGDRVALSPQAAQVEAKVAEAMKAPEIRNFLVDLARQLHNEGKLGQDLDKLADRMIDSVLEL